MTSGPEWGAGAPASDAEAYGLARRLIAERTGRLEALGATLSAEPVWDMLLKLFVAHEHGGEVPVCDLCRAAHVPRTTALRWIGILVNEGVIVRRKDNLDGRRTYVELADETVGRIHLLIGSWVPARATLRELPAAAPAEPLDGLTIVQRA